MNVRMNVVEAGVSNFRDFQLENREFMGWFRSQEEKRKQVDKRRSKIHFSLLTLLILLIVALFTFMLEHFDGKRPAALTIFSSSSMQDAATGPMRP